MRTLIYLFINNIYLSILILTIGMAGCINNEKYKNSYFTEVHTSNSFFIKSISKYKQGYYSKEHGNIVLIFLENDPFKLRFSMIQSHGKDYLSDRPAKFYLFYDSVYYFIYSGIEKVVNFDSTSTNQIPTGARGGDTGNTGLFDPALLIYEQNLATGKDTVYLYSNISYKYDLDKPYLHIFDLPERWVQNKQN